MSNEICLSSGLFEIFLGILVVTGYWMKLSVVTLLALRLSSHYFSSVSNIIVLTYYWIFSLDDGTLWRSFWSNYIFQQIRKVFFFFCGHACWFVCHVKPVQNILTTFEYLKIAWQFICYWRFLILCLVLCVFLFVDNFANAFLFLFLCYTFVEYNVFWFGLVSRIDLRWNFVN